MNRQSFISILLGLVLIGPFMGHYGFLVAKKYVLQKTMEERMEKSSSRVDLILFTFTSLEMAALDWEHDREFQLDGKMYDVIESCEEDNLNYLWCWADHQETLLGIRIKKLYKRWTSPEPMNKDSRNWQEWYKVKYTCCDSGQRLCASLNSRQIILCAETLRNREPGRPPYPPPRLINVT